MKTTCSFYILYCINNGSWFARARVTLCDVYTVWQVSKHDCTLDNTPGMMPQFPSKSCLTCITFSCIFKSLSVHWFSTKTWKWQPQNNLHEQNKIFLKVLIQKVMKLKTFFIIRGSVIQAELNSWRAKNTILLNQWKYILSRTNWLIFLSLDATQIIIIT